MDYIRTSYIVNMQFDAAGDIIVPVLWYKAADAAKVFKTPHAFVSSRDWTEHQQPTFGIGERWDSVPVYSKGGAPGYFPGTGEFCGPYEWFRDGCPSDAPPLTYINGIPGCCPQPPCQPWFATVTPPPLIVVAGFAGTWIFDAYDTFSVVYVNTDGFSDIQFAVNPATSCGVFFSTEGGASLLGYPDVIGLLLQSYDTTTNTGTWVPDGLAPAPPGFVVKFRFPP